MKPPNERVALQEVSERLAELLGLPPAETRAGEAIELASILLGGFTFFIEWKSSGTVAQVSPAAARAKQIAAAYSHRAIPLVAVPFMGSLGREQCREAGVGWMDLSGNAEITAPGIRIRIEGKPNCFKRLGRPASAFAPKSSRIARWLLLHPGQSLTQREIALATDMDEGFTSRVVARLEDDGLVVRESNGAIRVRDLGLLLDAWSEDYDFSKHELVKGHIATRSGEALLRRLTDELRAQEFNHAVTGMAAAWLFSRFASFRIVTAYVTERPAARFLEQLGFREETPGANVWLVIPADAGVFHGARDRDGVHCVHPVQAYLDLKDQPERASEAAARLRAELLGGHIDA